MSSPSYGVGNRHGQRPHRWLVVFLGLGLRLDSVIHEAEKKRSHRVDHAIVVEVDRQLDDRVVVHSSRSRSRLTIRCRSRSNPRRLAASWIATAVSAGVGTSTASGERGLRSRLAGAICHLVFCVRDRHARNRAAGNRNTFDEVRSVYLPAISGRVTTHRVNRGVRRRDRLRAVCRPLYFPTQSQIHSNLCQLVDQPLEPLFSGIFVQTRQFP